MEAGMSSGTASHGIPPCIATRDTLGGVYGDTHSIPSLYSWGYTLSVLCRGDILLGILALVSEYWDASTIHIACSTTYHDSCMVVEGTSACSREYP